MQAIGWRLRELNAARAPLPTIDPDRGRQRRGNETGDEFMTQRLIIEVAPVERLVDAVARHPEQFLPHALTSAA